MKVVCVHTRRYPMWYEEHQDKRRKENEKWLRQTHNDHNSEYNPFKKEPMPWPFLLVGWVILILMCCCKICSSGVQVPRAVSLPTLGEAETAPTAPPSTSPPPSSPSAAAESVDTAPQVGSRDRPLEKCFITAVTVTIFDRNIGRYITAHIY